MNLFRHSCTTSAWGSVVFSASSERNRSGVPAIVRVRGLAGPLTGRSIGDLRESLGADAFPLVGVGESVLYCGDAAVCPECKALA